MKFDNLNRRMISQFYHDINHFVPAEECDLPLSKEEKKTYINDQKELAIERSRTGIDVLAYQDTFYDYEWPDEPNYTSDEIILRIPEHSSGSLLAKDYVDACNGFYWAYDDVEHTIENSDSWNKAVNKMRGWETAIGAAENKIFTLIAKKIPDVSKDDVKQLELFLNKHGYYFDGNWWWHDSGNTCCFFLNKII